MRAHHHRHRRRRHHDPPESLEMEAQRKTVLKVATTRTINVAAAAAATDDADTKGRRSLVCELQIAKITGLQKLNIFLPVKIAAESARLQQPVAAR